MATKKQAEPVETNPAPEEAFALFEQREDLSSVLTTEVLMYRDGSISGEGVD